METELKLLLSSAEELEAVQRACGPVLRNVRQSNTYFDDRRLRWRDAGWSVRLRDEREGGRSRYLLTVKAPAPQRPGSSFVDRSEWEQTLQPGAAARARAGGDDLAALVVDLLHAQAAPAVPHPLDPRQLCALGVVENTRLLVDLPGEGPTLRLELDTTRYPDGSTGREIELELPEGAGAAAQGAAITRLRGVLQRAGVPWRPSTVTKLARFHSALRERR